MGCGPGGYWVELKELLGIRVWFWICGLAQVGLGLNENKNRRKKYVRNGKRNKKRREMGFIIILHKDILNNNNNNNHVNKNHR